MNEYAWQGTLRPMRPSLHPQHNTLRSMSPVVRAMQVMRREGARWVAEASFNPLDRRGSVSASRRASSGRRPAP